MSISKIQKGSPRFARVEAGFAQIALVLILLVGLAAGLFVVQNPTFFKPKASPNLPANPETSLELELEKNYEGFPDEPTPTSLPLDSKFRVDIYARSDIDEANLFAAKVKYTSDTVDLVQIHTRDGQTFIKNWVESSVDNSNPSVGVVSLVGGVPAPGIKTDSKSGALLLGTIIFKPKKVGTVKIEISDSSAIYRNSDNVNIITGRKGLVEVPIVPTATPTPTPAPISCGYITVEGAIVGQTAGTTTYTIESGTKIKLTANITPANTKLDWKEVSRSTNLPTAGKFDFPDANNTSIVNYTAPNNPVSTPEGLIIRADVAINDPTKTPPSCPSIIVVVKPAPQPTPTPTAIPASTSYQRVFITSTTYSGDLGGISGADAKCQDRANSVNLGGTWKAWITGSLPSTSPDSRFTKSSVPYKLVNGTTIANNWADLTDGTLQAPINITEQGVSKSNARVWSNTFRDGKLWGPDLLYGSCNNWSGKYQGSVGDNTKADYQWTNVSGIDEGDACGENRSLYCFEQASVSPSGTPTPTPTIVPGNGDGNNDGKVDLIDLSVLLTDFNKNGGFRTSIDLNGDGVVNSFDFSLMRNLLIKNGIIKDSGTNPTPTPSPTATPTPTATPAPARPEDIGISVSPFPLKMSSYTNGISVNPATVTCLVTSCIISLYSSNDLPGSGSTFIFGGGRMSKGQSQSMGIRTPFADPGVYNTQVTFNNNDTGQRVTIPFEVTILK